jgi:PKD repeat protein
MDMKIGPDGAMYLIEWGTLFGGGNADARIVRIEYRRPVELPMAQLAADAVFGAVPLAVQFSSAGTTSGTFGPVSYAWDFDDDGDVDSTELNPSHTYLERGMYTARLTITDQMGNTDAETILVDVRVPGDSDGDGDVDLVDFNVLKQNFGSTSAGWMDGDFDGDGDVDLGDFQLLKDFFAT